MRKQPLRTGFFVYGKDVLPHKQEGMTPFNSTTGHTSEEVKAAVEWLKSYLKQRKKGQDSIKIKSLLVVLNEAFPILYSPKGK